MAIADRNKERTVELAGRKFVLEQIPMARLRKLGPKVADIFKDFVTEIKPQAEGDEEQDNLVNKLIDKMLEVPYEILSLFIKGLPKDIFEDEENGVTFPEFETALKEALELNRADVLKNFFMKLAPSLKSLKTR